MKKFQGLGKNLSKSEQKKIIGGVAAHSNCTITINADCGGGTHSYYCNGSKDDCQSAGDTYCLANDCCDNLDCQPIYA